MLKNKDLLGLKDTPKEEIQLILDVAEEMKKIERCVECGQCMQKCPYELKVPDLLKRNYEDYKRILTGEIDVNS